MSEDYGGSKAEGILMTYSDSSSIKFSKTYNNRTKANQIGFYDILLFEGTQEGQSFKGTWYYQGY